MRPAKIGDGDARASMLENAAEPLLALAKRRLGPRPFHRMPHPFERPACECGLRLCPIPGCSAGDKEESFRGAIAHQRHGNRRPHAKRLVNRLCGLISSRAGVADKIRHRHQLAGKQPGDFLDAKVR